MSNAMVREFNGQPIEQRADGYMDATAMCRANGRKLSTYLRSQTTKVFIEELSSVVQICTTLLVQTRQGGNASEQGTYVHPQVATHLAQWCSAKFAVVVSKWVLDILTTGRAEVVRAEPGDHILAMCEMVMSQRRAQLEQERRLAVVEEKVDRAMQVADAAQQTADSNFGWFSVLGWCKRIGRHITVHQSAAVGRKLTAIMKRSGRQPHQTSDPRFGIVNLYPEPLLMDHFRDGVDLFEVCMN